MLVSFPPDGDRAQVIELARILEGATFADQDSSTYEPVGAAKDLTTLIRGSVAEAWNTSYVIIAKWSRTGKMAEFFDSCGRDAACAVEWNRRALASMITTTLWYVHSTAPP